MLEQVLWYILGQRFNKKREPRQAPFVVNIYQKQQEPILYKW